MQAWSQKQVPDRVCDNMQSPTWTGQGPDSSTDRVEGRIAKQEELLLYVASRPKPLGAEAQQS